MVSSSSIFIVFVPRKLNFSSPFFFFFLCVQDISGDDDAIDTGAGMTEVDEGVVEGQEIA